MTCIDDKETSKQETNQDSVDSIHLIIIMSPWLTVDFHLLKSSATINCPIDPSGQ